MIPKYNEIMLPFLKEIGNGKEYSTRELVKKLAMKFNLT